MRRARLKPTHATPTVYVCRSDVKILMPLIRLASVGIFKTSEVPTWELQSGQKCCRNETPRLTSEPETPGLPGRFRKSGPRSDASHIRRNQ
jgi:hypothetical protein